MPELPEVETLCRQLRREIVQRRILETVIYDQKLEGIENLRGRRINGVFRRGKNIVLLLDDTKEVMIHLRMTGRLFLSPKKKRERHTRWSLQMENCRIDLVDPRRFATVKLQKGQIGSGKERNDLITGFDFKKFMAKQAPRKVNVKMLLMEGKAVAGIGNIYACEILHRAGISPYKKSARITSEQWKALFQAARRILKTGIEKRGTSISDWRDLYGRQGENQFELQVYGKEGEKCSSCGGIISRINQGGRSTYFCSGCQGIDQ